VVEALNKATFTPNDTTLDFNHRMAIITGPNMGGKSTFMRQTALISLLAYCGSYVPAQSAVLGPRVQRLLRLPGRHHESHAERRAEHGVLMLYCCINMSTVTAQKKRKTHFQVKNEKHKN
jgi:hypothetical protein